MPETETLARRLRQYMTGLTEVARRGDAQEPSFYYVLQALVQDLARQAGRSDVQVTVQPRPTEAGNPDFRVWADPGRIIGYIEAKPPGTNLDTVEHSEQLQRYRNTFPNLILTDFLEFRLYQDGQRVDAVRIGQPVVLYGLQEAPPVQNEDRFRDLLNRFLDYSLPRTFTAESLAVELAKRTRFLRDVVLQELWEEQQSGNGRLLGFYEAFRKYLVGTLTEQGFADMFAQTITYGLFAARTRTPDGFNRRNAFQAIPRTIGVLRDLFRYISLEDLEDLSPQLAWIVDDIAHVLAIADVSGILDRYFREGKGSDPIVHFYETFLAQYDPEERERRGVYYTPEPVVSYIVRSVHRLLQTALGLPDGLADRRVTLLDPAAGTMTFVVHAAREAVGEFERRYGTGARDSFIREHILRNFYAFELMVAPYAVGHLKMAFHLEELGYRLADDERMPFYLTNTLEMEELEATQLPGLASLAEESHLAGQVKRETPILVIVGNPPYSGHSANRSWVIDAQGRRRLTWIGELIEDYKKVAGQPLGEKNPKWLQDDYVKFLRFAEWKIAQAGRGVVGMITNHAYLDNPTFRGMRWHLMQTFDEIYVLDLHGNIKKRERAPDGGKDENVFDIQQGVAIAFFVKRGPQRTGKTTVRHADLWGLRDQKYEWLKTHDVSTTNWQKLDPEPPFYLFRPQDPQLKELYQGYPSVPELFPVNSVGIVTARDRLTVHWKPDEVWTTVVQFLKMDPELARQAYNLGKDTRDWKVTLAQEDLRKSGPDRRYIVPILYRPFDVRYTYYTGRSRGFLCMPRPEVMRHMLAGENLALISVRQVAEGIFNHAFVTMNIVESRITLSNKGIGFIYPLYLYPVSSDIGQHQGELIAEAQSSGRQPNLNPQVITALQKAYGQAVAPEDIFYYVYAVLYAPTYRERYAEFLRLDFPRIPFTADAGLFTELATLGQRLVDLHLLRSSELNQPLAHFEGRGDNRVGRGRHGVRYDERAQGVYINDGQYFAPVAPEVWEYMVGGYQVCEKWLKDRTGRTLTLDEVRTYCRIVTALARTLELQAEIDRLYVEVEAQPMVNGE